MLQPRIEEVELGVNLTGNQNDDVELQMSLEELAGRIGLQEASLTRGQLLFGPRQNKPTVGRSHAVH
jgi:hypothetical protein